MQITQAIQAMYATATQAVQAKQATMASRDFMRPLLTNLYRKKSNY